MFSKAGRAFAVVAVAGSLAVAGCGDDDEETTPVTGASGASGATGSAGSEGALPADFTAEADALCKAADEEIDAAGSELGQAPSQEAQLQFIEDVVIPNTRDQIQAVRDLEPPDEGADELAAFLDDSDAALDELEADPSVVFEGGPDPFADVEAESRRLGFEECGN